MISKDDKPIAFYKNSAQVNYTTTERKLLSVVVTLKEFRNILFGQQIKEYTDHKNLTYKHLTFNVELIMWWSIIFKEYSPVLIYIQGSKNIATNAKNRLDIVDPPNSDKNNIKAVNEYYGLEDEDISHSTNYKPVM